MYTVTNFNWYYLMYYLAGDLKRESQSFQISEPALKKASELKKPDGALLVPPEVIAKLRPEVSDRVYTAEELKATFAKNLSAIEASEYSTPLFESLVEHISSKDGVWFATCEEIARAWEDDDDDRAGLAGEDVRGVEPAPADSGWR